MLVFPYVARSMMQKRYKPKIFRQELSHEMMVLKLLFLQNGKVNIINFNLRHRALSHTTKSQRFLTFFRRH